MTCPKCKARIGVVQQQITTESGSTCGALCYICGYWLQNYPASDTRVFNHSIIASEKEAGLFLKDEHVSAEGNLADSL